MSEALVCPENEHRMIISLDTSQMVKIIQVNPVMSNLLISNTELMSK